VHHGGRKFTVDVFRSTCTCGKNLPACAHLEALRSYCKRKRIPVERPWPCPACDREPKAMLTCPECHGQGYLPAAKAKTLWDQKYGPVRSAEENAILLKLFGRRPWDRDPPSFIAWRGPEDTP
jgi:hypothetical protein